MRWLTTVVMLLLVSAPRLSEALNKERDGDNPPGGGGIGTATGVIVAWEDKRNGTDYDIYARQVFPSMGASGVAVCTAEGDQTNPKVVSDGAGGAIVTWMDWRGPGNADIYAQRVSASGICMWGGDGVLICGAVDQQEYPVIASDNAGGAIIAWADFRNGLKWDVYAQRVNAEGQVQWAQHGVPLTAGANVWETRIVSDGGNGAIVSWIDYRGGGSSDIYAQHVFSSGLVDSRWPVNGAALCTAPGQQDASVITSDGAGGAIVGWQDHRGANQDIFVGRVTGTGTVPWGNGVALCSEVHDQYYPRIVTDGAGGAIATWYDPSRSNIYARRVSAAGVALWAADGVLLCAAANDQFNPQLVSDGSGGAIVVWGDSRTNIADLYAQRVSSGGAPQWAANGVALTTSASLYGDFVIASNDLGGAIVAWEDSRNLSDPDIYARPVSAAGVPQWTSNGLPVCTAAGDQILPAAETNDGNLRSSEDERRKAGAGGAPNAAVVHGEPAELGLWLSAATPNPARAGTELRLRLPQAADVRMDVFDASGRRVRGIPVGFQSAGEHVLRWDGRDGAGQSVATGVYFLRLGVDGTQLTRRLAVVRSM
jgi:hypothetical protein